MMTKTMIKIGFTFLMLVSLGLFIIRTAVDNTVDRDVDVYDVRQEFYSIQGKDSIRTEVYKGFQGGFIKTRVYLKENAYDNNKLRDSLDAVDFIERDKQFN
jgi:hypothetical protein